MQGRRNAEDIVQSFKQLETVNCGHYPMVFIPNFSTLKGEPQDQATNDKQYAETQQQRALERRLREEKRDLEVMKAQGAPAEQIKAQRERVRNASADIDEFCDKTGLPRRRNREYTPINATFPDTVSPINPIDPNTPPINIHLGDDNIPQMARKQIPINGQRGIDKSPLNNDAITPTLPTRSNQENIDWMFEQLERPNKNDFDDYDEYLKAREAYNNQRKNLQERTEQWFSEKYNNGMSEAEFAEWAERNGLQKVGSFSDIDPRTLASYSERFDQQIRDFPEVLESTRKIGADFKLTTASGGMNYVAEATQGMEFNRDIFKNLENVLFTEIDSTKIGFTVRGKDPIAQVYDHEFGHHVFRALKSRYYDAAGNGINGGFAKIQEIERDLAQTVIGKSGISQYATTDYDELFAEGFSAWYGGNKSEFATAFGEFMSRWW